MSSISAQGVVERASAELTKRINGLGLRAAGKHHRAPSPAPAANGGGEVVVAAAKASVMERVTNALCGGGGGGAGAPEKPSRLRPSGKAPAPASASAASPAVVNGSGGGGGVAASPGTPQLSRRGAPPPPPPGATPATSRPGRRQPQLQHRRQPNSWEQLLMDEMFLARFFLQYFSAAERRPLAQVCSRWRDVLYRSARYWSGLVPVLRCRELRAALPGERARLYASLLRRGFHSLALLGAADEDALDLVHAFPAASKHVHSLSLRCCSISDRGLEALLDHLQALFELELAGCNEVTEAGLWACLTPRIVSLTLSDCINVADEAVGAVAQLLPSLYEFSLQAYHVTDAALGYFSPKQSGSLSILRLHSCWELTNHGIVNIVHSLPNLTVLSLSGCSKITDDGVELIAENLGKLRSLDLSWCPRITDAALEYIACDLNQLEELTLDRCVHITDIGVGYVSTMLSLSALFLRWCSQLRDFGLQHLCGMRNLQVLSLAGCPLLTSSGLSSLIQLRHLQELELTNCPGASKELFEYLREHLPHCLVIE